MSESPKEAKIPGDIKLAVLTDNGLLSWNRLTLIRRYLDQYAYEGWLAGELNERFEAPRFEQFLREKYLAKDAEEFSREKHYKAIHPEDSAFIEKLAEKGSDLAIAYGGAMSPLEAPEDIKAEKMKYRPAAKFIESLSEYENEQIRRNVTEIISSCASFRGKKCAHLM